MEFEIINETNESMEQEQEPWTIQTNKSFKLNTKFIPKSYQEPSTNTVLKQPIFCNNCGKYGHFFYQCNNPITSIGIIAFRYLPLSHTMGSTNSLSGSHLTTRKREYLIIRRKDTLGYIDFIRGKYSIHNKQYIINMFKQMTDEERQRILQYIKEEMTQDYKFKLWRQLWTSEPQNITSCPTFHNNNTSYPPYEKTTKNFKMAEEKISKDKFIILANGMMNTSSFSSNSNSFEYNNEKKYYKHFQKRHPFSIQSLIEECEQKYPEWRWKEQEWGFPKGRRDSQESDFICGLREFTEETGYYKNIPIDLLTLYASKSNSYKEKENYKILSRNKDISEFQNSEKTCETSSNDTLLKNISKITGILNLFPFEENFIGSNYKPYKHKYYLMHMDYDTKRVEHQSSEVSNTAWKTYEECMEMFRFYNEEKKQMLTRIHNMLEQFNLY